MANLRKKIERIELVWKQKTPRLLKVRSFWVFILFTNMEALKSEE